MKKSQRLPEPPVMEQLLNEKEPLKAGWKMLVADRDINHLDIENIDELREEIRTAFYLGATHSVMLLTGLFGPEPSPERAKKKSKCLLAVFEEVREFTAKYGEPDHGEN